MVFAENIRLFLFWIICLTLFLLMLGVLADNHNNAFSLDYLAFIANFLNGRLYFHFDSTFPFNFLLGTPCYASLG